jgi:Ser-tRNA(Ala) deacylase AlaX
MMSTRRLFDEDSHLCRFEARIIGIEHPGFRGGSAGLEAGVDFSGSTAVGPSAPPHADDHSSTGPWVALNATAFFPEEGGQRADQGDLSGVQVAGLRTDDAGVIWHRLTTDPGWAIGQRVTGRVDPLIRRDHRQQHSGQHILSRVFSERLQAPTRSFHMGVDGSTIDVEDRGRLDSANARKIENRANEIVMDDIPVMVTEQARPGDRPLRTVEIENESTLLRDAREVTGEVGHKDLA